MGTVPNIAPVRVLPEDLVNKIAAGEVIERPASVVKELTENSIDARATRIVVRLVAAGRRTVEVIDNGHGMSEQDALLSIERHATSKIRKVEDLDSIRTMGFRGEALSSIASVSKFELTTRRAQDEAATRIRIEGGTVRDVSQAAAPVGTRIKVDRLYFNTPVRAKFLKGITTELSHAIDIVQRHALAHAGVGFELLHNEKSLLDIPEKATLRERVALIWGLNFVNEMLDIDGEHAGFKVRGLIGAPGLTRAQRSHQFFFLNQRPVMNRSLQYGFEDGYRGLLTVGRHAVGILLIEVHPRFVDVNVHPTKREVRFRDERAAHEALREIVRTRLAAIESASNRLDKGGPVTLPRQAFRTIAETQRTVMAPRADPSTAVPPPPASPPPPAAPLRDKEPVQNKPSVQSVFPGTEAYAAPGQVKPDAVYAPLELSGDAPLQVFGTYLIVPDKDRLLIIDQHALHERLMYDALRADLEEQDYDAQQLAVPLLVDVPPSHMKLLESNIALFAKLGILIEPFGGNTFQVTAICHLYDESRIPDAIYRVLDGLAQGDFFDRKDFMEDSLRMTIEACRGAVKAGDALAPEERRGLIEGFKRLRPPYTCPHGRPIVTELTQLQMEKSFRRKQ